MALNTTEWFRALHMGAQLDQPLHLWVHRHVDWVGNGLSFCVARIQSKEGFGSNGACKRMGSSPSPEYLEVIQSSTMDGGMVGNGFSLREEELLAS